MRELINNADNRTTIRWKLLTGVSALALAAHVSSVGATDADRPVIWLQASGQFDQLDDNQAVWIPQFVPGYLVGPLAGQYTSIQKKPRIGFDADASISFQPKDSDWSFHAAIKIGKARQPGSVLATQHLASNGKYNSQYGGSSHNNESHQAIDFQVGKDVGFGTVAWHADSTIRAGVRIADLRSRSDVHVSTIAPGLFKGFVANVIANDASNSISRKFAGAGPSIAWDASVPIAGTAQDGELALDWSAAAALLFGRQTTRQNTHATYQVKKFLPTNAGIFNTEVTYRHETQYTRLRSRNVTVPNFGASIGVSYRWPSARVSLGYRADMFFNAIDGGIATRKNENRGFYGPYASISIGFSPWDF